MTELEALLAREQIRQLAHRYAVAVDAKDVDTLVGLFAEDVTSGRYGSGREGIRTFFDNVLRGFHCSMHLIANHVIDFDDDDHAHGILYCRVHHHRLDPEHWQDAAMAYWDTYERHDERWYFRRRQPTSWYTQEFGHPEHGIERRLGQPERSGTQRGIAMPEAFPTFTEFWERQPTPIPPRG